MVPPTLQVTITPRERREGREYQNAKMNPTRGWSLTLEFKEFLSGGGPKSGGEDLSRWGRRVHEVESLMQPVRTGYFCLSRGTDQQNGKRTSIYPTKEKKENGLKGI